VSRAIYFVIAMMAGVERSGPILYCLRAFRQIARSAGCREIDEGIGTAAAERKDMIGLKLLV
jgi:hypothetical protein